MLVKRIDMALHVQELCAQHRISVTYQTADAVNPFYWANREMRRINIRPTKNTGYYVSALHEIGHIVGENQHMLSSITVELYAWIWARETALLWNDTAERVMNSAMDSYGWGDSDKNLWQQTNNRVATVE